MDRCFGVGRVTFIFAAMLFSATSATAGDYAQNPWAGARFGISGGYGIEHLREGYYFPLADPSLQRSGYRYKLKGGFIGSFVGYNIPVTRTIYVGPEIEGDFDLLSSPRPHPVINPEAPSESGGAFQYRQRWSADTSVRLGAGLGMISPYVEGGLVLSQLEHNDYSPFEPGLAGREHVIELGWLAGAGVELALSHRIFIRAAYRHIDYSENRVNWLLPEGSLTRNSNSVRGGLGIRF